MTKDEFAAQASLIYRMHAEEGRTFVAIGKALGMSRQRAFQIAFMKEVEIRIDRLRETGEELRAGTINEFHAVKRIAALTDWKIKP